MEEIIEIAKKVESYYSDFNIVFEFRSDSSIILWDKKESDLLFWVDTFDSLEDLRNHLNG